MIRVIVNQRDNQPDCWFINESSETGVSGGKICYKTRAEASIVARQQHPNVNIKVQE